MAGYETILYEVADGVARLTLNRPQVRNAMSPQLLGELLDALDSAHSDPGVRVVVLTGAGERAFCAGGDLGGIGQGQERGEAPSSPEGPTAMFKALIGLGKPLVGRVNGLALAGGLGLACACDILIAAHDARFGTPEVNVGLWPMVIMSVISRSVGPKQALKLYMTGELIDAEEAFRIGLVTEVVPREELDARVDALAASLAAKSPVIMKLGRDAYYAHREMPFDEQLRFLTEQLTRVAATEDSKEGVRAFLEKRRPVYRGM